MKYALCSERSECDVRGDECTDLDQKNSFGTGQNPLVRTLVDHRISFRLFFRLNFPDASETRRVMPSQRSTGAQCTLLLCIRPR